MKYTIPVKTSVNVAKPHRMPVITRFRLLDSYFVNRCVSPSMGRGSIRIGRTRSAVFIGRSTNGNRRTARMRPSMIPVHLAHSGNW